MRSLLSITLFFAIFFCFSEVASGKNLNTQSDEEYLDINFQVQDVSCQNERNGTITVSIEGGTSPFEFVWSSLAGNAAGNRVTGLRGNLWYSVTVTDAVGISKVDSAFVDIVSDFNAEAIITTPTCNNSYDAELSLEVDGDFAEPLVYKWTGNDFSSEEKDLNNIMGGNYFLELTDGNQCTQYFAFYVEPPAPVSYTVNVSDYGKYGISCSGNNDGFIEITDIEGQGNADNFNFEMEGPFGFSLNATAAYGLYEGTYSFSVTDEEGCSSQTENIEITAPQPLELEISFSGAGETYQVSCGGSKDGFIDINVTGGHGQYVYHWFSMEGNLPLDEIHNEDQFNLPGGKYYLTVSDTLKNSLEECQVYDVITLNEPMKIEYNAEIVDGFCPGTHGGKIEISDVTGFGPFEIEWEGPGISGAPENMLSGLEAGEYVLTITDTLGCALKDTFRLESLEEIQAQLLSAGFDIEDLANIDLADISLENSFVQLWIEGGNGIPDNFDVSWTGPDGFTSEDIAIYGLTFGTYSIVITDEASCQKELKFNLESPFATDIDASTSSSIKAFPNPFHQSTAIVLPVEMTFSSIHLVDISGKLMDFEYTVNENQIHIQRQNLSSGTYFLVLEGNTQEVVKLMVE